MHNIATIYRFNTPFLDLKIERNKLVSVIKKIKKSLEFDGISIIKSIENIGNYYKVTLVFSNNLGKVEFFYIADDIEKYYFPVFKLNIFLDLKFLSNDRIKRKTVLFLNNIFECFDGLNEKEFLIDLDNNIYYEYGFLKRKKFPDYDFSDIEEIRKIFEKKNGVVLIEDFIKRFSGKVFELSINDSKYYHKLHSIFLYLVYLVFLMSQNIENDEKTILELEKIKKVGLHEEHIELMKKRLLYVENLHLETFEKYKSRLELFFKLF